MPAKPDFRDAAVAASEALLAQRGGTVDDPFPADVSFCLRASEDGEQVLRQSRRRLILAAILGIAGIAGGGAIALWGMSQHFSNDAEESNVLLIAGCCSLGGFAVLIGYLMWLRRMVRRRVGDRLDDLPRQGNHRPTSVTLENTATAHVPKAMTEDAALLILHPERRCVRIEGISHRYFIRAEDCESVTLAGGETQYYSSARFRIVYRIGDVALDISVAPDAVLKQIGWQLSGRIPALYDQLRRCLM
jgi:hypothetical protein